MSTAAPAMRTDLDGGGRAMAKGAAVNLGGAAATNILSFVLLFVTTRVISVQSVGLLSLGTTVVTLALVPAVLGLDTGSVRFVARAAAIGDERAARGACQAALAVALLASTVLAVVIYWRAPELAGLLHKRAAVSLLRISALGLPGLALGRVALAATQGFGVMSYAAGFGALRVATNVVLAITLVSVGLGVRGLAAAATVTAWITCAASLAALVRIHPLALRLSRDTWHTGTMLRFSLPQTLSGMLFFTILWTDTLILARFGSAAQVGVYTVAGRLVTPAMLISTAIGQMFAPRIAAADARGARASLSTMLKRVTYWNTVVSLPFFTTLAIASAPLLRMFGGRYAVGATALTILALGQLVNTAAGPLGQVINMSGRPYVNLMNNALVAALNVGGCLVLIPRYGLTGAACSTAGALTLVNAIKLVELRVMLGLWPFRSDSLRTFAAAGGAAGVAVLLAYSHRWGSSFLEVAVVGTVLFAAYVQLVILVAVRGEERATLRRGWDAAVRAAGGRGAA